MKHVRVIARLDIKGTNLIKGVHLEGLRVIGDPQHYATKYYHDGADELIYMDAVASLYGRNNISEIVEKTAENVFVPITVGGGIRSVNDARLLLRCGADKIAINTAAIINPTLLSELADVFGSQSVVLSVEAKRIDVNRWVAYTDNGREKTDIDVIEWCQKAVGLGVGEILLTSIDQEGTYAGFDTQLVDTVCKAISVPVIASGGFGSVEHLSSVLDTGVQAIATASMLHYKKMALSDIKREICQLNRFLVRVVA